MCASLHVCTVALSKYFANESEPAPEPNPTCCTTHTRTHKNVRTCAHLAHAHTCLHVHTHCVYAHTHAHPALPLLLARSVASLTACMQGCRNTKHMPLVGSIWMYMLHTQALIQARYTHKWTHKQTARTDYGLATSSSFKFSRCLSAENANVYPMSYTCDITLC